MHRPVRQTPPPPDPFASGTADRPRSIFDPEYGPEVVASFASDCDASACFQGGEIFEGDIIRADGEGGWVHTECADDD